MQFLRKPISIIVLLGFTLYSLPILLSHKFTVTDEVGLDHFSTLLATTGSISYTPEDDVTFGFSGFVPTQSVYNPSGEVVPRQPPGFIFLAALVKILTPGSLYILINPLLGALCIMVLYKIALRVSGNASNALYVAIFMASTPIVVHWSQMFFVDIANLLGFLLAIWCLLLAAERPPLMPLLLLGLSLGATIWIRQSSVILVVPLGLYFLLTHSSMKRVYWLVPAIVIAIALGLLLVYNLHIYGSPLQSGYGLDTPPACSNCAESPLTTNLRIALGTENFYLTRVKWIVPALTLAFPPFILACIGIYLGFRDPDRRNFSILIATLFLILFVFFAKRGTYGLEKFDLSLQASLLRYMLPLVALLPVPTLWVLQDFKLLRLRWISIIVAVNLLVALFAHFGVVHTTLIRLYMEDVTEFVSSHTHDRTVIISPYWKQIIHGHRSIYSVSGTRANTAESVMHEILEQGYDVSLIYHESDHDFFQRVEDNFTVETFTGPQDLHFLLELLPVPIPSHVYPVKLLNIYSDAKE